MGMSPSSAWRKEGKSPINASSGTISHRVCTAASYRRRMIESRRRGCLAIAPGPMRFSALLQEAGMKEVRKVHYVKGVFVCPKCRQSYVQEKWIESWRVRCHRCDYRGALTDVSVEERMEEETFRR